MIHGSISHVKSAAAAKREKEVPQNWSKIFLKLQELTRLNAAQLQGLVVGCSWRYFFRSIDQYFDRLKRLQKVYCKII